MNGGEFVRGGDFLYSFRFQYDGDESSALILPLAPESFNTHEKGVNKVINLISGGEFNILKDIGLRDFSFKILLPKDNRLTNMESFEFKEPAFYLDHFRQFKSNKRPVRMIITRPLPSGKFIFAGNLLVSFEDYHVEENAGEEGDFWISFNLKEFRNVSVNTLNVYGKTSDGKTIVTEQSVRQSKNTAKEYVVKKGDSLWKIAKTQLNDGSRYKEISELNSIKNPNLIYAGMKLLLP